MWLLFVGLTALAAGDPVDVREVLRPGVTMNWTTLTLEAEAADRGYGVGSSRAAVEQNVRRAIGPSIMGGAMDLRLDPRNTLADVELLDKAVFEQVRLRLSGWKVTEARYYTSGRVDLRGELSVQELLKPLSLSRAQPAPEGEQPSFTGWVIDARGLEVKKVIFPRVLDDQGAVIWQASLWEPDALRALPVIYVSSPTAGATAIAGANPLVVEAEWARGGEPALSAADTIRFHTGLEGARVLGEGRVVVVVDP
ncbi:MAG: hypothetical protein JXX28_08655 [Deltaproteobacteria bacterium]|nr:hypothetical protein [Deltaproteobacteria bacterium]